MTASTASSGFYIYRSSAGSGKTYRLAIEFISLCIADPGLYNKILAVTFTNKATREMKDRILGYLEILSGGSESGLMAEIRKKTGMAPELIKTRAATVLDNILHNYSQLSISTIDSFFQKIVKAFARELGLMGNFSVELDTEKVLDEVADRLIADVGKDVELTQWLLEFSSDAVESGDAWDIRRKVKKFAFEILKESVSSIAQVNTTEARPDFQEFLRELKHDRVRFESAMRRLATEAMALIESRKLTVDDFAYKQSGPAGYFTNIIKKKSFEPGKRFREAIADESKWITKSSPSADACRKLLSEGLAAKADELWNYYLENYQSYNTAVQVMANFYLYGIMSKLSLKLQEYRLENDIMLISDLPVFLQRIIAGNETPFIYEKTGSWYRHYLIDEFQDTSAFQWGNFKPLIDNGLAQGQKSLLVGDGKQSIYRWRGGDWGLILNQVENDLNHHTVVKEELRTNWRSEAHIVEFNNNLYAMAPAAITSKIQEGIEVPDERLRATLLNATEEILSLYEDVNQELSPKITVPGGEVLVKVFEKDTELKWTANALEQLPRDIERIQDMGISAGETAILVRRSEEGRKVIEQLLKYKYSAKAKPGYIYNAVSSESMYIGKAPVVRLLVNCLAFCADPTDDLVLAEIKLNYFLLHNSSAGIEAMDIDEILEGVSLAVDFKHILPAISTLPVYDMVERFIQLFGLQRPEWCVYMEAFQDIVLRYFTDRSKNLEDFLVWWLEEGNTKSLAAMDSGGAIRVLTIHKSKGLEYGAVIIPFCDWSLSPEAHHGTILWCESEQKPFAGKGKFPVKYTGALASTWFAWDYFEEMIRGNIDNLNLLYVATTRAVSYLQINCPPVSDKLSASGDVVTRAIKSMAESLDSTLSIEQYSDETNTQCYRIGGVGTSIHTKETKAEERSSHAYQSADWQQKVQIRQGLPTPEPLTMPEWKARVSYGLLIHEILASAGSREEAMDMLEKWQKSQRISGGDFEKAATQLQRIFTLDIVKGWFSARWSVKREAEIIAGSGRFKRPDRVLIDGDSAVVIDFKTGQARDKDRHQVTQYAGLLSKMGYKAIEAYLLYIESAEVEKVV